MHFAEERVPCVIPLDVHMRAEERKPGIEVDRWIAGVLAEQEPTHAA